MENLPVALGKRIRRFRRARKMKLSELAQITDINEKYLSRIELGKINTSTINLNVIATGLRVPLPILLDCHDSLDRNNLLKALRDKTVQLSDDMLLSLFKVVSELPTSESTKKDTNKKEL